VVRWSARYEETVTFYRDTIGLPVLETFRDSYGLDGTILGLPGGQVHLEIVRAGQASYPGGGLDQLVFYLPDAAAWERMQGLARRHGCPTGCPDRLLAGQRRCHLPGPGRAEAVFASWIYIPPGS
jgi:catechol 2,3-dioxygenase-like lactoylglutathione lyase family enzyme